MRGPLLTLRPSTTGPRPHFYKVDPTPCPPSTIAVLEDHEVTYPSLKLWTTTPQPSLTSSPPFTPTVKPKLGHQLEGLYLMKVLSLVCTSSGGGEVA
jgi:hypothetical protein